MLGQYAEELSVSTRGRALYEITREVAALVTASGFTTGLATLHVRHTSASLLIQENADPSVRTDLESIFARLAPDADPVYEHNYEGDVLRKRINAVKPHEHVEEHMHITYRTTCDPGCKAVNT